MLVRGQLTHMVRFERSHLNDPAYYRWITDLDVVRYIGRDELLAGIPFEEVKEYAEQLWSNEFCIFLAVYHTESDKFIGTAKINFTNVGGRKHGLADIGIMLGERDFWGKGLATDILGAVSAYAFDELQARKLIAGAMSPNKAVVKAFLRLGYVEEGTLRAQLPIGDGYCDHVLFGCFPGELNRSVKA